MKIIDLSQTFKNDMPQFPGTPSLFIEQIAQVKDGGFRITDFHSVVHVGTHCDAPAHCIEGGKTLDELPLETFVGEAVIVDANVKESKEIPVDILEGVDIKSGDIVIIRTGYSRYWGEEKYIKDSPYLSEELAGALSKMKIRSVGIDFLSPDKVDSATSPIHNMLMGKEIPFIENLANLEKIDKKRFFFSAAPILIHKSDGGLARSFAVLED